MDFLFDRLTSFLKFFEHSISGVLKVRFEIDSTNSTYSSIYVSFSLTLFLSFYDGIIKYSQWIFILEKVLSVFNGRTRCICNIFFSVFTIYLHFRFTFFHLD